MPAHAQTSQVEVSGHVAPRCWVILTTVPWSAESVQLPRAICNQSPPRLESRMRALDVTDAATGLLLPAAFDPRTLPQQSARAAMEIVISPQL